jgi:hypothetical protein
MGFVDGEHCLYVTKKNFDEVVKEVKERPSQEMADKARQLVLGKWTARHFADYIYGQSYRT